MYDEVPVAEVEAKRGVGGSPAPSVFVQVAVPFAIGAGLAMGLGMVFYLARGVDVLWGPFLVGGLCAGMGVSFIVAVLKGWTWIEKTPAFNNWEFLLGKRIARPLTGLLMCLMVAVGFLATIAPGAMMKPRVMAQEPPMNPAAAFARPLRQEARNAPQPPVEANPVEFDAAKIRKEAADAAKAGQDAFEKSQEEFRKQREKMQAENDERRREHAARQEKRQGENDERQKQQRERFEKIQAENAEQRRRFEARREKGADFAAKLLEELNSDSAATRRSALLRFATSVKEIEGDTTALYTRVLELLKTGSVAEQQSILLRMDGWGRKEDVAVLEEVSKSTTNAVVRRRCEEIARKLRGNE